MSVRAGEESSFEGPCQAPKDDKLDSVLSVSKTVL